MLAMPVMAVAMATSLMAAGTTPAAAAAPAPADVVVAAAQQPVPDPETMDAADWRELKQNLNASSTARTVTVAGGARTLLYTLASGTVLELREPVGPQSDVTTQVSAGGCGFLQLCVYFTPLEQRMILGGAGAALGAAICFATGPVGCVAAAFVVGAAFVYLSERGVCGYRLRVRVLPTVGGVRCV